MRSRVVSSERRDRGGSLGPFWAIAWADLRGLLGSRITVGWVLIAVFIQVVRTLGGSADGTISQVLTSGVSDFVYIWALVIIGLAASSVSSESGELADSVMSKAVTRFDYVLGKFVARVAYTLVTFSLVTAVLVGLGLRLEAGGYDPLGLVAGILLVALAMVMLTTMGVGLSVAMPGTVPAIVTLLVLWYAMTVLFPAVGFAVLSPGTLLANLPEIIGGTWGWMEWEITLAFALTAGASVALSSAYFYLKDI